MAKVACKIASHKIAIIAEAHHRLRFKLRNRHDKLLSAIVQDSRLSYKDFIMFQAYCQPIFTRKFIQPHLHRCGRVCKRLSGKKTGRCLTLPAKYGKIIIEIYTSKI
jgi:hypothetical protein